MSNVLSTAEVAVRLGVDVRTVHRMVKRGELTPLIQGAGIRGPMFFEADSVPERQAS